MKKTVLAGNKPKPQYQIYAKTDRTEQPKKLK